jgi:membrane-bound serine protease (ClpP class)
MSNLTEFLSNPDVLLLLLVLGGLGLATELVHPNVITGILGALALILAVIGLAGLPVNWLGLVLLAFGFVLIVLETQVASYGLLALGGAVAIALGAAVLFNGPTTPGAQPVSVSPAVILAISGAAGLVALGLGFVASRTRRMRAPEGQLGTAVPAGTPGIVKAALDPLGTVQLAGETWSARTQDGRPIPRDTPVRLIGFDRLTAIVEPAALDQPAATAATRSTDPSSATPAADRP